MNNSLNELKIKNIESVTIYDADGNELIKLEPMLKNSVESKGITLTFGDAIESLEKKTQLPEMLPAWTKNQEQIAKALKEIVWRFPERKAKYCNDCVYFDEPCFCMGQKGMPRVELDEAKRCESFKLKEE